MVIVAGEGESKRFGGCRLLNELDSDHSLLSHAVEQALGCKSTSVFVVIGRWHNEIKQAQQNGRLAEVPLIYNPEWSLGLGSSIAHGVRTLAADYDAICIMLADQITLRNEDFNQLISSSPPGHIVCSYYKRKRGVPALFPSCCFNQLIQLKGESGARDQLRGDSFPVSEISLPYAEHDIDTKKELFELRRLK